MLNTPLQHTILTLNQQLQANVRGAIQVLEMS